MHREHLTRYTALGHFALSRLLGPPSRGQTLRDDLQISLHLLLNTPPLSSRPETSETLSMYIVMHPELLKRRSKPVVPGNTKVIYIPKGV